MPRTPPPLRAHRRFSNVQTRCVPPERDSTSYAATWAGSRLPEQPMWAPLPHPPRPEPATPPHARNRPRAKQPDRVVGAVGFDLGNRCRASGMTQPAAARTRALPPCPRPQHLPPAGATPHSTHPRTHQPHPTHLIHRFLRHHRHPHHAPLRNATACSRPTFRPRSGHEATHNARAAAAPRPASRTPGKAHLLSVNDGRKGKQRIRTVSVPPSSRRQGIIAAREHSI